MESYSNRKSNKSVGVVRNLSRNKTHPLSRSVSSANSFERMKIGEVGVYGDDQNYLHVGREKSPESSRA